MIHANILPQDIKRRPMSSGEKQQADPATSKDRASSSQIDSLEQLVDRLNDVDDNHDPIDLRALLHQIGQRSFGTLLLLAGSIVLAPLIGDVPGVPTLCAVMVAIASVQLLAGRQHFWLPDIILKRSISRARLEKIVKFLKKPARFIDRFTRRRMEILVSSTSIRFIGAVTLAVALVMPALELIPFSANLAGIALSAFGVSLIARDGLFAAASFLTTASVFMVLTFGLANV